MQVKQIEVRDAGTFIPCLAIQVSGEDGYLMRRAGYGYGHPCILLMRADGGPLGSHGLCVTYEPHAWGGRTMPVVHQHLIDKWDAIADGDVVDVEFILGETEMPKESERTTTVMAELNLDDDEVPLPAPWSVD